jgi:hydroxyacylglutathione hydrolase
MKIIPIPCLSDNYAYLVVCEATGHAGVVDPSEAAPVVARVEKEGVELHAILNTHHHWDHIGGNKDLLKRYPGLTVYGHVSDKGRIDGQSEWIDTGDTFLLGKLECRALHNPGHTSGAVSYVIEDNVFTGDTMFAGGCGRLLEGTPEMMYKSLNQVIGSLPKATNVYFGHEYTENNLRFAQNVEPGNRAAQQKLAQVRKMRGAGRFTTPSTLEEEWSTNPFMRCDNEEIIARVKKEDPANDLRPESVLGAVRRMKDSF